MIFKAVGHMTRMLETKISRCSLDARTGLNLLVRLEQPLFGQPFLGIAAHFLKEKPPQGLHRDTEMFRQRRRTPVRLLCQFHPVLNFIKSVVHGFEGKTLFL